MNNAQRMLVWGLGWLAATLARGDVHVAPNGPGPAPFSSWATAAPDIQTAVTAAPPGGTVLISNGVYALAATIIVDRNLTLRGMPAAAPPTIDGGSAVRCLAAAAGTTVQLESLRFVNGTGGATGLHGGGACIVQWRRPRLCLLQQRRHGVGRLWRRLVPQRFGRRGADPVCA